MYDLSWDRAAILRFPLGSIPWKPIKVSCTENSKLLAGSAATQLFNAVTANEAAECYTAYLVNSAWIIIYRSLTLMVPLQAKKLWARFWMQYGGMSPLGCAATRLASWGAPPFYRRRYLANLNPNGYVSPSATIHHNSLRLSMGTFIDDRVLIYQDRDGGPVKLDRKVLIYRDTIIQTGAGGSVTIGAYSSLQPRCQLSAYKGTIQIGCNVQIAPNCAFYPYDHGIAIDKPINKQPLQTKGGIIVEDNAWLGVGVIVLSGVRIGKGAVIGAGSVVTKDIPENAIAVGAPARVVGNRKGPESESRIPVDAGQIHTA